MWVTRKKLEEVMHKPMLEDYKKNFAADMLNID